MSIPTADQAAVGHEVAKCDHQWDDAAEKAQIEDRFDEGLKTEAGIGRREAENDRR